MKIVLYIILYVITSTYASVGDRTHHFSDCLDGCSLNNCSKDIEKVQKNQSKLLQVIGWSCYEECKYECMWDTVSLFIQKNEPIPQFYGKWPFIRVVGFQEFFSAVFSLFNGLTNVYMLFQVINNVSCLAPYYYIWIAYCLVAINAWIWSFVFHAKETNFTEMMDYFSAIFLMIFSSYVLVLRLTLNKIRILQVFLSLPFITFFAFHVHYLAFIRFDYGYNMKAMITVGIINAMSWFLWCAKVFKTQPYVWKAATSSSLALFFVLLELGDFVPIFWLIDAHSLWHASTIPLPLLWFSFVIDDCHYLYKKSKIKI